MVVMYLTPTVARASGPAVVIITAGVTVVSDGAASGPPLPPGAPRSKGTSGDPAAPSAGPGLSAAPSAPASGAMSPWGDEQASASANVASKNRRTATPCAFALKTLPHRKDPTDQAPDRTPGSAV